MNQWDDIHSTSNKKASKRLVKKGFLRLKLMNLIVMLFSKGQAVNTQPRSLIVIAEILPKKVHKIEFAYELHLFNPPCEVASTDVPQLNKNEAMQIIKSVLTPEEQQIFGYFCYHCGNNNASEELFPIEFANKLIGANLACEVTDTAKLLKHLHISKVRKFLPPGTKSPRTKAELIDIVAPTVNNNDIIFPDEKKCLTLHPSVSHLGHTIHRQICIMYPDSEQEYV
ncbi:hypothetical protein [Enterocloster sp.]|uniref:hypothetical protein n=1 Tax=Enterocloster sp. TaxID=2719315 RepID=UPI0039A0B3E1